MKYEEYEFIIFENLLVIISLYSSNYLSIDYLINFMNIVNFIKITITFTIIIMIIIITIEMIIITIIIIIKFICFISIIIAIMTNYFAIFYYHSLNIKLFKFIHLQ